jgi:hypothetical protein
MEINMNDINSLYADVPPREHNFQLEVEGSISKKRYIGDFTCKIPNVKDQCFIAKHQAMLNGNFAQFLDPGILNLHKMIAYLRYTLTEYPKFWKMSDLGYNLLDMNVIQEVYDQVLKFEKSWLKEVWGDEYEEDGESETTEEG